VSDIKSLIETVQSQRYAGITYKEGIICPKCEIKRADNPCTLNFEEATGWFCPKGHKVDTQDELLAGKIDAPPAFIQPDRKIVEAIDDHSCPKLFVVLPINKKSLGISLKDRLVYSLIRDGYAVHLICECPGQWHFVSSPGFRVGKPKEFFRKYGGRVCKLIRVISAVGAPFKVPSALEPHCKAVAAVANAADSFHKEMKSLLDDYLEKFPQMDTKLGSPDDDLAYLESADGLAGANLAKFLEIECSGKYFGSLFSIYADSCRKWLWLCEEHYKQYKVVQRK